MKQLITLFFLVLALNATVRAQISTYHCYDNAYNAVFDVADMGPNEIKDYNYFKGTMGENLALYFINLNRTYWNLKEAPATIVEWNSAKNIKDSTYYGEDDESIFNFIIMNTTTKTIKDITFMFCFFYDDKQVYDINTGDQYCIITFHNIKGRKENSNYADMLELTKCIKTASFQESFICTTKHFVNKRANRCVLENVKINYTNGSTSDKVAIFDTSDGKYNLWEDGPFNPTNDILDIVDLDEELNKLHKNN